jgi:hypothetical protein
MQVKASLFIFTSPEGVKFRVIKSRIKLRFRTWTRVSATAQVAFVSARSSDAVASARLKVRLHHQLKWKFRAALNGLGDLRPLQALVSRMSIERDLQLDQVGW